MVSPDTATRIFLDKTATSDAAFKLVDVDVFYFDLTVWCQTNNAYMGTGDKQTAPLNTGNVYFDRNGNINDLWFKNRTAGSNTNIIAVATVPNENAKAILGYG